MGRFIILFFSILPVVSTTVDQGLKDQIIKQNQAMEEAFQAGDMKKVAWFYLDDAILLSPGSDPQKGREAIDAYWTGIQNPVSWNLEVITISTELKDIYAHEYYRALEAKPPSWKMEGIMIEENDPTVVYQLGRSTLVTKSKGQERKSVVEFILVWKYTEEGYRIFVDTYTW